MFAQCVQSIKQICCAVPAAATVARSEVAKTSALGNEIWRHHRHLKLTNKRKCALQYGVVNDAMAGVVFGAQHRAFRDQTLRSNQPQRGTRTSLKHALQYLPPIVADCERMHALQVVGAGHMQNSAGSGREHPCTEIKIN